MSGGGFKGRAAPEIDIIEAMTERNIGGTLSQSFQLAPFNAEYTLLPGSKYDIDGRFGTVMNAYKVCIPQSGVTAAC